MKLKHFQDLAAFLKKILSAAIICKDAGYIHVGVSADEL